MPETTVAAIVKKQGEKSLKILLTLRNHPPYRGYWCLPGGHIDAYETAKTAVEREIKEETGLEIQARFFAYFDEIIPEKGLHAVVLVFEGHGSGRLEAQVSEVAEMGWFTLEEALSLDLAFRHQAIIQEFTDRYTLAKL
jgi:8-oxo-dGTP diphosphatase